MAKRKKIIRRKKPQLKVTDQRTEDKRIRNEVGSILFGHISPVVMDPKSGRTHPVDISDFMDFLEGMACNDNI